MIFEPFVRSILRQNRPERSVEFSIRGAAAADRSSLRTTPWSIGNVGLGHRACGGSSWFFDRLRTARSTFHPLCGVGADIGSSILRAAALGSLGPNEGDRRCRTGVLRRPHAGGLPFDSGAKGAVRRRGTSGGGFAHRLQYYSRQAGARRKARIFKNDRFARVDASARFPRKGIVRRRRARSDRRHAALRGRRTRGRGIRSVDVPMALRPNRYDDDRLGRLAFHARRLLPLSVWAIAIGRCPVAIPSRTDPRTRCDRRYSIVDRISLCCPHTWAGHRIFHACDDAGRRLGDRPHHYAGMPHGVAVVAYSFGHRRRWSFDGEPSRSTRGAAERLTPESDVYGCPI